MDPDADLEMQLDTRRDTQIDATLGPERDAGPELVPRFDIAIQGEPGSFSHQAALALAAQIASEQSSAFSIQRAGPAEIVPCALSPEVFRQLASGLVEAAVIPIENSLAGSVLEHYDLLLTHDVVIEREYLLRIRHNLIAAPGTKLADLRTVYSHPIALDQCRGFFRAHPHLRAASFYDTAGSVKHILSPGAGPAAGQEACAGAIASRQAAIEYGGSVLLEGIEDNPQNYTRFFLLRRAASVRAAGSAILQPPTFTPSPIKPPNKVSLCFAVENRPGSLVDALGVFAAQQTNLTRLESRPVPGSPWQYIFYADYQMERPREADAALAELARHCSMVKELGRYRAAELPE